MKHRGMCIWKRCPVALVAVLALGSAPVALAEIVVRDDGVKGLVFSNVVEGQSASAAGAPTMRSGTRGSGARALFAPLVRAASQAHGIPEALLFAVIEVESGFDAAVVSPKGALGLMQLMPQTARALHVRDARDPAANIDGGARYLKELLALFSGDLQLALAAYNAGPGAVLRAHGIPRIQETQKYVPQVLALYNRLQSSSQ